MCVSQRVNIKKKKKVIAREFDDQEETFKKGGREFCDKINATNDSFRESIAKKREKKDEFLFLYKRRRYLSQYSHLGKVDIYGGNPTKAVRGNLLGGGELRKEWRKWVGGVSGGGLVDFIILVIMVWPSQKNLPVGPKE